MKNTQTLSDKLAIGLSVACTFHCLALPLILAMIPSLTALQLDNESFHLWMIVAVVPSSIYALTLGCKQHKDYKIVATGLVGLSLLVLAVVLGEATVSEFGEKALTLVGSIFVATGHWLNYSRCRSKRKNDESCCANG
ncbi:MerC domain-containing protein [Alteromonas sp. 5E99-2]|uniref:MerC domain-containing protein n=1 Tax=Alteromonas sp. 5E99-2 TaxID=2817683 RepID=UPI001A98206D|nr:MerC domain-containing protein [Alteromonas sp. 5E99-2]MBO1255014.1 MerC domain-containing protein [Alteromonas sp. 5E99-2]